MAFEWDEDKAELNRRKHGISFVDAETVFDDPIHVEFYDPDHAHDEHRYVVMGQSQHGRVLVVSYTKRGDIVRLISARRATRA